ncbi:MAG: lysophospholipase [Bdellovibrionota bacterium]
MDPSTLDCHFAPVFTSQQKFKNPQTPSQPAGFHALPPDWVVEFETIPLANAHLFAHLFRGPKPELQHKAIVLLHGQGEHSGRYLHVPHYLGDVVGSVYAIDHRGHGQSSGNRGHIAQFDDYANDAALAVKRYSRYLTKRYGKAEIHLICHSMGGLVGLRMLQLHPELQIASVTMSAPMIELAFKVPKIKHLAAILMNKVLPSLSIPGEPLAELVSRDPNVVKHYRADRYNHGLASPAFYLSYLAVREKLLAAARDFRHPLLFLIPTADKIIDPKASFEFYDKVFAPEKKLIRYENYYHEIMNEPGKDQVFADIKEWIKAHSAG